MPRELVVHRVSALSSRVRGFDLVDPAGGALPPFEAGAHVAVHLPDGTVRHYSLYNDPRERHRYRMAVSLEEHGRGGSRHLHEHVGEGDRMIVSEPRNLFRLAPSGKRHLLIAGGIGITPILSMIHALEARHASYDLVYLVRSADDAPFSDILLGEPYLPHVTLHADGGRPETRFPLERFIPGWDEGTHLYCCGPAPLMGAVRALTASWPEDHVHFEAFTASAEPTGGAAFTVKLDRSGRSFEVGADETILDVLLKAGVDVDYSCKEGTCGTCLARILDGNADHRDAVLTPSEKARNRDILICCSRALTPSLTLDL